MVVLTWFRMFWPDIGNVHWDSHLLQVGSRTFAIQAREAKVAGSTNNIPYTNVKKTRPAKIHQNTIQAQCGIEYWYRVPAYKCKIARILRYQQCIRWMIRWFSQLRSSATLPTCSSQVHASGRKCLLWWLSLAKNQRISWSMYIYIYTQYAHILFHTYLYIDCHYFVYLLNWPMGPIPNYHLDFIELIWGVIF